MRLLILLSFAFALQAAGTLKITDAGVHQTEDGPLALVGSFLIPGDTVYYSCRLEGYQVSPEKKVDIRYEFVAADPDGVALVESVDGKIQAELSAEDKEWKPKIRQTIVVPSFARSGKYKIRVTARDALSGDIAAMETSFEVRGHAVEPSATLTIRNFGFYRKEDDTEPLAVASFRPGDSVWGRFDITGYKFGPVNLRDVAYTVTVTAESGKVLLKPGEPSVDKDSSFYPARYVPCAFSFNLQPTLAVGSYTVSVQAHDRVGGQSAEWKQVFQVE